jgi:hypothetical protein
MRDGPDLALVPAGNRGGTAAIMPEGRRFAPGHSGNPRGRPKRDLELAELAREYTLDALAALAEVMGDQAAPPAARVSAAMALLDPGLRQATAVARRDTAAHAGRRV